jgi:hypothetical protein
MDKKNSLFLDPPHILPPDTVLTPQCENCGKPLGSPYHIMIGIPPSSLIVDALPCKSIDEEKDAEKIIIWVIQSEARDFKIDSKNQWIFSKQNIRSSKIRACNQCYEEYTCSYKWNPIASGVRTRKVCFAVEEYQRRHAPIEPNMSDYEKYIIPLPDRATVHWKHFGEGDVKDDEDHIDWAYFEGDMYESLRIALIPDYTTKLYKTSARSQEFRSNFIQEKDRLIPNNQELTKWMKKRISNYDKSIQYCMIFINPKTKKYPVYHSNEKEDNTSFTVVVHYSIPEGDWDEYDI